MGIAMGCMGMSMDDFCRCTPSEFQEAYTAWQEEINMAERTQWERTRMQCLCMIQPYAKKKLRAQDVMTFDWEQQQLPPTQGRHKAEPLSHDEIMARYREAKKRMGIE